MAAAVLLYNLPAPKANKLRALCVRQGVQTLFVPPRDQGKTIGQLLGLPIPAKPGPGTVPGELMVLSGFTSQALDDFLDGFGPAGVGPIPMKAVVTPHNLAWTGVELYLELVKERRAEH